MARKQTNALTVQAQAKTVRVALERMTEQFEAALPKHVTVERMLRVAMTAIQTTPKLLECNRTTLYAAIMSAAQLGLILDGALGQAYLVPYGDKVQLIVGYKGMIHLAKQSGEVGSIVLREVCENDHIEATEAPMMLNHQMQLKGERGKITHFYAVAYDKAGREIQHEIMTKAEVDAIRARSKAQSGPWKSDYVMMGRKTPMRRLAKYIPQATALQQAVAMEEALERGQTSRIDPKGGGLVIDMPVVQQEERAPEEKTRGQLDEFSDDAPPPSGGEEGRNYEREPGQDDGDDDNIPY